MNNVASAVGTPPIDVFFRTKDEYVAQSTMKILNERLR